MYDLEDQKIVMQNQLKINDLVKKKEGIHTLKDLIMENKTWRGSSYCQTQLDYKKDSQCYFL